MKKFTRAGAERVRGVSRGAGNGAGSGSHENGFEREREILPFPHRTHALVRTYMRDRSLYSMRSFILASEET